MEYTSPDEVAVCNLASLALNRFVLPDRTYDFKKLFEVTKVVTRNLNRIIDVNYYPVEEVGILFIWLMLGVTVLILLARVVTYLGSCFFKRFFCIFRPEIPT